MAKASRREAEQALEAAWAAFPAWSGLPAQARASVLFKAGRHHAPAQAGAGRPGWSTRLDKAWDEAEGDVAEAIDFLEYYGRQAHAAGPARPRWRPSPDEANELRYRAPRRRRGHPALELPPGHPDRHDHGAVAAGNTVVLKPASNTPVIGAKFVEIMEEAGVPPGVVNFLPGDGARSATSWSTTRASASSAFTGSQGGGPAHRRAAAKPQPGQRWIKRVVGRDGRQGRHHRGRRRRPGGGRGRHRRLGLRLPGPEVLGLLAGHRAEAVYDEVLERVVQRTRGPRGSARHEAYAEPSRRRRRPSSLRHDPATTSRSARRRAGCVTGGGRATGRRLLHRADHLRRRAADGPHRAGGDLRPGAGLHQGRRLRRGAAHRQRHRSTA